MFLSMPALSLPNAISKTLCSGFILFLARLQSLRNKRKLQWGFGRLTLIVALRSAAIVSSLLSCHLPFLIQDSSWNSHCNGRKPEESSLVHPALRHCCRMIFAGHVSSPLCPKGFYFDSAQGQSVYSITDYVLCRNQLIKFILQFNTLDTNITR